ncbi:MAG TPA: prolyl aminopeptidase, partial [Polyangiales bacterium]|nr:prolyl aminopeptidase [Polyangiales bacterium]
MHEQPLRSPYPEIAPFETGRLRVDDLHELHYEQYGNPAGKPAVFVHGGPGGGTTPAQARFWDPSRYRIVLFDQRGCGKSTPHASLERNTTWHLVADMERLRKHLNISRWQVFGGSWGSTLGLAYAETHPNCVTELILRGVFTLRPRELAWFYQDGASRIFPDAWEHYLAPIPPRERGDMMKAYYKRLTSRDRRVRLRAARAWSIWEGSTSKLFFDPALVKKFGGGKFADAFARIEAHYFVNRGFLKQDDQLLRDVRKIRKIPGVIV